MTSRFIITLLIATILCTTPVWGQKPLKKPEKPTASVKPTNNINGHEAVDLGLSVKWATCNVGASSPSDCGNYYAWGETTIKSKYTKRNSITYRISMCNICGDARYDAATANWGDSWRLPTKAEIEELINRCTWISTTQGVHNGYKVTGKNGKSIFLPAAGYRDGTTRYDAGPTMGAIGLARPTGTATSMRTTSASSATTWTGAGATATTGVPFVP